MSIQKKKPRLKLKPYIPDGTKTTAEDFPKISPDAKHPEDIPKYFRVMDSQEVKDSSMLLILNEIRNVKDDISPRKAIFVLAKLKSLSEIVDIGSFLATKNLISSKFVSDQVPEDN